MAELKRFQIFGERNSGTNYLQKLLSKNFKDFNFVEESNNMQNFGWKHGALDSKMCYYEFDNPEKLIVPENLNYSNQSDDVLFLVIFRNPYTWIQSMQKQPHSAPKSWWIDMHTFVNQPWETYFSLPGQPSSKDREYAMSCVTDKNLYEKYENISKLRTDKLEQHLRIKNQVSNVVELNYEQLAKNPNKLLSEIGKKFSLNNSKEFENITEDKFGDKKYKKKKYSPLSFEDIKKVHRDLDWKLEKEVGYSFNQDEFDIYLKENKPSLWQKYIKQTNQVRDPSMFIDIDYKLSFYKDGKKF